MLIFWYANLDQPILMYHPLLYPPHDNLSNHVIILLPPPLDPLAGIVPLPDHSIPTLFVYPIAEGLQDLLREVCASMQVMIEMV